MEVVEEENEVNWVALSDDTWAVVGSHLGLQALTLRQTCTSLRTALEMLPRATRLALDVIKFGTYKIRPTWRSAQGSDAPVRGDLLGPACSDLLGRLMVLPYHEFFNVLRTLRTYDTAILRRWKTTGWEATKKCFEISGVMGMRSNELRHCSLEDQEGHVLSEAELVTTMRWYLDMGEFNPSKIIVRETDDGNFDDWTSTFHLAAEKGMLQVLRFLVYECRGLQPLHTRTPGGNNAYAHADRALKKKMADADLTDDQKKQAKAKYEEVLSFLRGIGLSIRPWRDLASNDEDDMSNSEEASDFDYDEIYDEEYMQEQESEAISEASEGSGTFQVWDGDGYA